MVFSSQCGVSVIGVAVGNQRLSLSIQAPASVRRGYFEGLLGNYDGDAANDVVTADHMTSDPAAMSMMNYWIYGESCGSLAIKSNLSIYQASFQQYIGQVFAQNVPQQSHCHVSIQKQHTCVLLLVDVLVTISMKFEQPG